MNIHVVNSSFLSPRFLHLFWLGRHSVCKTSHLDAHGSLALPLRAFMETADLGKLCWHSGSSHLVLHFRSSVPSWGRGMKRVSPAITGCQGPLKIIQATFTPASKDGKSHPWQKQILQDLVECLHRCRCGDLLRAACFIVETTLTVKQLLFVFEWSLLCFNVPVAFCAFTGYHWEDSAFVFFSLPIRYLSTKLCIPAVMLFPKFFTIHFKISAFPVRGPFNIFTPKVQEPGGRWGMG